MTKQGGGTKRSSWLTFRRRLLLVRALLRTPATSAELVTVINAELGEQGYPEAAVAALKHDFDALKGEYGCSITYDRSSRHYILADLGELALLDLPEPCMEALAFLEASFPEGSGLPEHANLRALLERVVLLLPAARQAQHRGRRSTIRLGFGQGAGRIDSDTLAIVKHAVEERRELAFDYLSTFDAAIPRRHRVAPYGITFRPEGHGYLDATVLEVTPKGGEVIHAAIDYRLDRIVPGTLAVLPAVLPPIRPTPPSYGLRYTLVPQVARRKDVAAYFPNTDISYHDDGSATVKATVTNLWQARQVLLRYGDACIVHEPPELVRLFHKTTEGLTRIYRAE
ncbi:WYL domain-containing protein [Scytonema tolypothrichoides VB-61278]|nr:WYL domain-containing protein [Scytonema tolypothrichoides VB-61278]